MASPRPIALTQSATAPTPGFAPEDVVIVGEIPAGALPVTALTAVPALADTAAVKAYLDILVPQLKSSPYFS